jgi:hypothetical protein
MNQLAEQLDLPLMEIITLAFGVDRVIAACYLTNAKRVSLMATAGSMTHFN